MALGGSLILHALTRVWILFTSNGVWAINWGVKDSYFLPQPDSDGVYIEILEGNEKSLGYIAAIDYLTIDDSRRLRRQVQTLNNNKSEIEKLKGEFEQYKKDLIDIVR